MSLGKNQMKTYGELLDSSDDEKDQLVGRAWKGYDAALRRSKTLDFDDLLVGDEREAPYSRMAIPYLLIGHIGESGTHLRHDGQHFQKLRIELRRARATQVDVAKRCLALDDGTVLTEITAICEYLDEAYPEPRLMPADPADGAHVRALAMTVAFPSLPIHKGRIPYGSRNASKP